jgi:hypothetical protein
MDKYDHQKKYEKWWLGKHCRLAGSNRRFKLVKDINLFGPPSFVYGSVELVFADNSAECVYHGQSFKPRKKDVEVKL